MKDQIKIVDWAGNLLFAGNYQSKDVDQALEANRCNCDQDCCDTCDDTGYSGDFYIY